MNANPETTMQQLSRVRYQRKAMQGVLKKRMLPVSLDRCRIPGFNPNDPKGIQQCIEQLLKYACEENALRQRLKRKCKLANGLTEPSSSWQLRAMTSDGKELTFRIIDPISITGRDSRCELVLPLPNISRRHLVLTPQAECLIVRDLESTNGTYVNGERIRESALKHGDNLAIAGQVFTLEYCGVSEGIFVA